MKPMDVSHDSEKDSCGDSANWIETVCLNCGSNDQTAVKYPLSFSVENLSHETFSARRQTEHYHYRILGCRNCGLVFSSPVLSPGRLAELYRGSKLKYENEVADIARTYIRYLRRHEKALQRKDTALEIGCGSGFFLRELKHFGFAHVFGVEPSEDSVAKAGDLRNEISTGFFEEAEYERNTFDLICCFQTLDHVIDPAGVLRKAYELLRPGGVLYIIVHNEHALQARLFGERSPIYDVEHIYLFNPKTLSRVCEKASFQNIEVFSVCNTYPLDYWLRMSPIPGRNFWRKASDWLGVSQMPVCVPAGNIGAIARKPGGP
jgi:SAM-dependent methyltransferase